MPMITVQLGAKLSPDAKQELAEGLGKTIAAIPGKSRANLIVCIQDDQYLFYDGRPREAIVHMNVLLYRTAAKDEKALFVADSHTLLTRILGRTDLGMYTTIVESDQWGVGASFK